MPARIAYIMSRFPRLTETFILREMDELRYRDWDVQIYPLVVEHPRVVQPQAHAWMSRVQRVPFLSRGVLASNSRAWRDHPKEYGTLLNRALAENRTSLKFLSRALALFPKAVYTARHMQQKDIRHIHAHFATHPALEAWLIHQLTGISYSVTVHAHDIFVRQEMLSVKLRDAAFIVAISEYNRDYLARTIGPWVRSKTHIIHCGIMPDEYTVRVPFPHERFEVVSIGSLEPYKGHRYLIEACAALRDKGIPVHCRIIGGGGERRMLEQLVSKIRMERAIELLGPQSHDAIAQILPTADCYVQPSIVTPTGKMEGLPVSITEALACGLPVVASSISGIPELVVPDETGYLVPPADATALARTLAGVYANPAQAQAIAQHGRARVLADFDLRTNVGKLSALFEQVVARSEKTMNSVFI